MEEEQARKKIRGSVVGRSFMGRGSEGRGETSSTGASASIDVSWTALRDNLVFALSEIRTAPCAYTQDA